MTAHPRQSRWIAGALAIAIVSAALLGFLISRPRTPLAPFTPTPLTKVVAPVYPAATAGYSVANDLASKQIVVFGGLADNQATWLWDGIRWDLAQPASSPAGRIDAAAAYDPALHLVLLFGGHGPPGTDLTDTWAWGGASWRELDPGKHSPPPSDAVMAWNPAGSEMVLVAGAPNGAGTRTWIWSGERWTPLAASLPFPPSSVSLGYDPSSGRLLAAAVPAGNTLAEAPAQTQTWAWNGVGWDNITASGTPVAKAVVGLGWDPFTRHLLLFTADASTTHSLETWEWDGPGWRQSSTNADAILSGMIVSTDTSLLLVGALDDGGGVPKSIGVWSWAVDAWTPA